MKLGIVGTGRLGSQIAYTVIERGLATSIALVDVNPELAEGQAMDLSHAAYDKEVSVHSGGFPALSGADIAVVTAGKPRLPGQTRLDLINSNLPIARDIAERIAEYAPNCRIITLTNPMDVMNYAMHVYTGFGRERVIGSGGVLDSARLRAIIAQQRGTRASEVEAFVLGEHGENQTPVLSKVHVSRKPLTYGEGREKLREELRLVAAKVIEKKKGTEFAPASATADMIQAIALDEKRMLPCSAVLDGEYGLKGLSIGVPCILGKQGIEKIEEWLLDDWERNVFMAGAYELQKHCSKIAR